MIFMIPIPAASKEIELTALRAAANQLWLHCLRRFNLHSNINSEPPG